MYSRRVLAGEFTVINKQLFRDLNELGLWNNDMKDKILANNGSIQMIENIPENIKEIYKVFFSFFLKHGDNTSIDCLGNTSKNCDQHGS